MIFECKRYANPVGAPLIRNFRGAMEGRVTHGIFVTTSTFTNEAQKEANRPGAKQVQLIDGIN